MSKRALESSLERIERITTDLKTILGEDNIDYLTLLDSIKENALKESKSGKYAKSDKYAKSVDSKKSREYTSEDFLEYLYDIINASRRYDVDEDTLKWRLEVMLSNYSEGFNFQEHFPNLEYSGAFFINLKLSDLVINVIGTHGENISEEGHNKYFKLSKLIEELHETRLAVPGVAGVRSSIDFSKEAISSEDIPEKSASKSDDDISNISHVIESVLQSDTEISVEKIGKKITEKLRETYTFPPGSDFKEEAREQHKGSLTPRYYEKSDYVLQKEYCRSGQEIDIGLAGAAWEIEAYITDEHVTTAEPIPIFILKDILIAKGEGRITRNTGENYKGITKQELFIYESFFHMKKKISIDYSCAVYLDDSSDSAVRLNRSNQRKTDNLSMKIQLVKKQIENIEKWINENPVEVTSTREASQYTQEACEKVHSGIECEDIIPRYRKDRMHQVLQKDLTELKKELTMLEGQLKVEVELKGGKNKKTKKSRKCKKTKKTRKTKKSRNYKKTRKLYK